MYNYTVVLDDNYEPSNGEERTQVAEYVAMYETKDNHGWKISAMSQSGVWSAWKAKFPRIDIGNTKIICITGPSGEIIFQ